MLHDAEWPGRLHEGQRPRHKPAQGNALGNRMKTGKALKGRDNLCRPFRAHFLGGIATQGVALGWLVAAPLVLAEFLTALVAALNDRAKLPDLDRFPEWRDQPPVPLDAPSPGRILTVPPRTKSVRSAAFTPLERSYRDGMRFAEVRS